MKGFAWGGFKHAQHLTYTFILCHCKAFFQTLLSDPSVPNQGHVGHGRNDNCIVNLAPVEHVDAADQVAKDVDPADGGAAPAFHKLHVMFSVVVLVNKGAKVPYWGLGNVDVLGAVDGVSVLDPWN